MKAPRRSLFALGVAAALAVLGMGFALLPGFQTWLGRQVLASQFWGHTTVESVSFGWRRLAVTNLRIVGPAGTALAVPFLEAELSLWRALTGRAVEIANCVALGWTLRLAADSPDQTGSFSVLPAVEAAARGFAALRLPWNLSFANLRLTGEIELPDGRGRARVAVNGGGLGVGLDGRFDFDGRIVLRDPGVDTVVFHGSVRASMDTPRTFARLGATLAASASGDRFPVAAKLTAAVEAFRDSEGGQFSVTVAGQDRPIFRLDSGVAGAASRLEGRWQVDVNETDLEPFSLGHPLPRFTMSGEGVFDADAQPRSVHVAGQLDLRASRLEWLNPKLSAAGPLSLAADFDVARRGGALTVRRLVAALGSVQPVAEVRALQAFTLHGDTGVLQAADPDRELLSLELTGLPLGWVAPLLGPVEATGGALRGLLVAQTYDGGIALRSLGPLELLGLDLGRAGRPLLQNVDLSFTPRIDYTPQGWQAALEKLELRNGGVGLLAFTGRTGRLMGADQPLKAEGRMALRLPTLLEQPVASDWPPVTAGVADIEFTASRAAEWQWRVQLGLSDLATADGDSTAKLPALALALRADVADTGRIEFAAPLHLEKEARISELTMRGAIDRAVGGIRTIDIEISGSRIALEDATAWGGLWPKSVVNAGLSGLRENLPFWAGLRGTVAVQLGSVTRADTFNLGRVGGLIRVGERLLEFADFRATVRPGSEAQVDAKLMFDASASAPYYFVANLGLHNFDSVALLGDPGAGRPATLTGDFAATGHVAGRAAEPAGIARALTGNIRLTSNGGVFRGLPVRPNLATENSSRIAGWIASAGAALNAMTGRRDHTAIASRTQAVAELASALSAISYDQLGVVMSRDGGRDTFLREFTLIAPEIRLAGKGRAVSRPESGLLDDALEMEFDLRARGRIAELLQYLGVLATEPDELGYRACTLPLTVGGTLGMPDAAESNRRLAALAVERSGITERASELLNRILGGGK